MTLWLYTEEDDPLTDGPFFTLDEAFGSFLWEFSGVCLWMEELVGARLARYFLRCPTCGRDSAGVSVGRVILGSPDGPQAG